MAADPKTMDRARDELFSHINRCGVLQAAEDDQKTWMDETIDYLGERYPDLSDPDLKGLYSVGIRFCKPAIRNGARAVEPEPTEVGDSPAQVTTPTEVKTATEATTTAEGRAGVEAEAPVEATAGAAAE